MSEQLCHVTRCGRPVLDAFVCQPCADELTEDLRAIITAHQSPPPAAIVVDDRGREKLAPRPPGWIGRDLSSPFDHNAGLLAELVAAYSRESRSGRGGKASDTLLVWHEKAGELRKQLIATLVRYVRLVADARGITLPADVAERANPLTLASWLERHVAWLRHQQAGAAAVTDVHRLVTSITRIIDPLDDRQFIGLCTARPLAADDCSCSCHTKVKQRLLCDAPAVCHHKGAICGTSLHASMTTVEIQCPTCRQTYAVAEHRQWLLDALEGVLATATEIATALTSLEMPVTPARIRQWKHRGRIEVRGYRPRRVDVDPAEDDTSGDPLYRLGDVKALRDAEIAAAARRDARKAG